MTQCDTIMCKRPLPIALRPIAANRGLEIWHWQRHTLSAGSGCSGFVRAHGFSLALVFCEDRAESRGVTQRLWSNCRFVVGGMCLLHWYLKCG